MNKTMLQTMKWQFSMLVITSFSRFVQKHSSYTNIGVTCQAVVWATSPLEHRITQKVNKQTTSHLKNRLKN